MRLHLVVDNDRLWLPADVVARARARNEAIRSETAPRLASRARRRALAAAAAWMAAHTQLVGIAAVGLGWLFLLLLGGVR